MGLVLAPIKEGKLEAYKNWIKEITEKKAAFDDMNKRHGITRHEVWLAETPAGPMAAVIHDGPGADEFMPNVANSNNSFDIWFKNSILDLHGMDLGAPLPGPNPVKMI
jgi:hypothetical protein